MFRWICDVPAAMVKDSVFTRSSTTRALPVPATSSMNSAARPSTCAARSPMRWRLSVNRSLNTDAPCTGTIPAAASETFLRVSDHSPDTSAASRPRSRRSAASSQSTPPPGAGVALASATVSASRLRDSITSPMNAVPRSNENVTMATRQPSFSAPTRLATGTRTSSRISSPNSRLPTTVRSGRTWTPGARIGRISQLMPRCLGAS